MSRNLIPATYLLFEGDDELDHGRTLVEVTGRYPDGFVEIAYDHGGERMFLRLSLIDLLEFALRLPEEPDPDADGC